MVKRIDDPQEIVNFRENELVLIESWVEYSEDVRNPFQPLSLFREYILVGCI